MQSNLKNKKILVTGCAGFIGSFVTEALLQKGAKVFGIDDLSSGSLLNMQTFQNNKYFTFTKGDVGKQNLIEPLIKKVDVIYHAAVRGLGISTANPLSELQVNVEATLKLLELTLKHKVEKFLYTSSASVYGNVSKLPENEQDPTFPLSPYGVSKLAAERYCMAYHKLYDIPIVCLRYFNVYGPRQRWDSVYGGVVSIFLYNTLRNKPLPIYGNGKQTRDFTYIHDAVQASIAAFESNKTVGHVINIASGKEYTVNELAKLVKKVSGKKDLKIEYVKGRLIDNINRRVGDISLAKKILNFTPSTSLEQGLKKTYQWCNDHFGSF